MTEPKMPAALEAEWYAEEERHLDAIVRICHEWPNFRKHFACALLGSAIAMCDMMGVDADEVIRKLRAMEPKPAPLVPPRSS